MDDSQSKDDFFHSLDKLNEDDEGPQFNSFDIGPASSFEHSASTQCASQQPKEVAHRGPEDSLDQDPVSFYSSRQTSPKRLSNRPKDASLPEPDSSAAAGIPHSATSFDFDAFRGDIPRAPKYTGKKRQSRSRIQRAAQEHQIFRGLVFYFFPNDDTQSAIRDSISQAIDYGAKWTRHFRHFVTHVIVADGLSASELDKFVGLETVAHAHIVHVKFLFQCIKMRILLDATEYKSLIPGFEACSKRRWSHRQQSPTDPSPPASPKVKAEKSRQAADADETPQRPLNASSDEDSSLEERIQSPVRRSEEWKKPLRSRFVHGEGALEQAIQDAKRNPQVLDDSDDSDEPPSEASASPQPSRTEMMTAVPKWQTSFACMQPPGARQNAQQSPNAPVIAILQEMADYYDGIKDQWRTRAYRMAMNALRKHDKEVTSAAEALQLPGIGRRLAAKIEEIRLTSRLRRLDNARLDEHDAALKLFTTIYGVGIAQAHQWVARGLRSLADLAVHAVPLTPSQRVGVAHHADFAQRIPRAEVAAHAAAVTAALTKIDPDFCVVVGGSFRRGAPDCGDIDIIISHESASLAYTRTVVFDTLIPRLTAKGFLVAALAVSGPGPDCGTKWHGASQLAPSAADGAPRPWRRIDLLLVPREELGAALLYWTGNDVFNRSMRLLARRKGMCLNQRGLYKHVIRSTGQVKLNEGTRVAGEDERDIFRILGVPWRECTERNA